MPDTPEPGQANLPPDLLAGSKIAFVKRVPRGLDYGLDNYAFDRFARYFGRSRPQRSWMRAHDE